MFASQSIGRRSWTLLLLTLALGCAGRFDGSLFRKQHVDYRVRVPEPVWQRVDGEGNDLAFYRPGHGCIAVNATCTDYEDVPQGALLNHLLFGTSHRKYLLEEEVTLDGRAAQHALIDAELDGVPVRLEVYLLTRAGCVFDLTYVSDRAAKGRAQFAGFVQAFHIEAVHRD